MAIAGIKSQYVLLSPSDPVGMPPNSIYVDNTQGNSMIVKGSSGGTTVISGGESVGYFVKEMVIGGAVSKHQTVAKRSDGKVVPADADDVTAQAFIGYAQNDGAADGDHINVLLIGPNVEGAVSGLGFAPGDVVYLAQNAGGYINNVNNLTDNNDILLKVGIADCGPAVASATAVDLISFVEKILDP